jgi:hypothetical protein
MGVGRLLAMVWLAIGVTISTAAAEEAQSFSVMPQETRVALVIGNSAYTAVAPLPNTARDADAVAQALRNAGFGTVQVQNDMGYDAMRRALRDFAVEAERADWALVYYAGHGIEVGGQNYLIPVDARLRTDRDVQFEAVPLDQVLGSVEGAKKLRLVILDACRDNPFVQQMTRTLASRSIARGLARIEPESNVLVAYSAKAGQLALDGDGPNSPFANALVKRMAIPNIEIRRFFGFVRDDVLAATGYKQEPFVYGSLGGEELFFKTAPVPVSPDIANPVAPTSTAAASALPANKGWDQLLDGTFSTPMDLYGYSEVLPQIRELLGNSDDEYRELLDGVGSAEVKGKLVVGLACIPHWCSSGGALFVADSVNRKLYLAWKPAGKIISVRPKVSEWPTLPRRELANWAHGFDLGAAAVAAPLPPSDHAASLPSGAQAKDYPAAIYNGPTKLPEFNGRDRAYASFRTRIRDGIKAGPNFAGRMALIVFGCGTECRSAFAADVSTGKVNDFPLGGEEYLDLHLEYSVKSRLVIAHWLKDSRCIRQNVLWDGHEFSTSDTVDVGDRTACDALGNN